MTGAGFVCIIVQESGSFVYRVFVNINSILHGEAAAVRYGVIL